MLKIYNWFIVIIINIIAINVIVFFSFLLFLSLVFGYYFVYHHHHHHHHHHYYNFIIILAIITPVWRICILHHNQSLDFYVILNHLHFWAEQLSFLNPCIFSAFPFSILTIRVVPWGTTITWQLYNAILAFYLKTICSKNSRKLPNFLRNSKKEMRVIRCNNIGLHMKWKYFYIWIYYMSS